MEKLNAAITIESTPIVKSPPIMAEPTVKPAESANDQVRIVDPENYKEAAQCIAEAFMNDDVSRYFVHTDIDGFKSWSPDSVKLHNSIFEYLTYAHCLRGLVTTTGPNYSCVALWMPPGKNMDDWVTMFKSGMWRLRYQLTAEGSKRFFNEFLPLLHETKTKALGADDQKSWYLVYIGTRPAAQGKGYAKALIEMVAKHADAAGEKLYLESSHKRNTEYYKRRGFQPATNIPNIYLRRDRSRAPIELDIMVRQPDPSKLETHTAYSRDNDCHDAA